MSLMLKSQMRVMEELALLEWAVLGQGRVGVGDEMKSADAEFSIMMMMMAVLEVLM